MSQVTEPGADAPVCSIICTTYNHSAFCRAALAHSPFPHRLISQENTGNVPLNVNRAIKAATGDYVSFLSLDDLLMPDAISSKMQIIRQNPNVVLVANTANMEIDDAGQVTCAHFTSPLYRQSYASAQELLDVEHDNLGTFYLQACVVKADLVRATGGMDPDISGDDIVLRTKIFLHMVQDPRMEFALIHKPGMKYRKHGNNLHLNVWNQIKTVVDWHDRYFPERPFPELANAWIDHFINQSLEARNHKALVHASRYSPILKARIGKHTNTWKYRRRHAKAVLKRAILLRPLFRPDS
jgi:glycosyltransferase involved in cell wall biosynthesis